ncbi:MAG: DUF2306 domain-containing protein [Candidatus Eremiobacterota bacterium]
MIWAAVAAAMGWVSFGYVTGDPSHFDALFRPKYLQHLAVVVFHGVLGITALVVGPLQFYPRLHSLWPSLHRTAGILYLTAVCLSSLGGLRLALIAEGGTFARTGFTLLALAWLGTALRAVLAVRRGDYAEHRAWMVRNYALTFSAVTLRGNLYLLQALGLTWGSIYPWMAWLSWLPNLALAELLFNVRRREVRHA